MLIVHVFENNLNILYNFKILTNLTLLFMKIMKWSCVKIYIQLSCMGEPMCGQITQI